MEEAKKPWNYLFRNSVSKNVFVRYSWLNKMILHPDINEHYVYIIYEEDVPIVGVPISKPKYKGDYTDILYSKLAIENNLAEEIKQILKEDFGEWYPMGSFLKYNSYFVERNKNKINFSIYEPKQTWDIQLPESNDNYLQKFKAKKRYNLDRSRKKLIKDFDAEIEINCGLDHLDDFYDLHEKRWGNRWTTGQLRKFMDAIIMDEENEVWLNRIDIGGHAVYVSLCFECEEVLYSFLSGSNFSNKPLQALSPGIMLNLAIIEEAINKGLKEYDLMKGNAWYKQFLGAQKRDRYYIERANL